MAAKHRLLALATSAVVAAALAQVVPGAETATGSSPAAPRPHSKSVDPALGNGLGRLVAQADGKARITTGGLRVDQDSLSIRDGAGRVLVDLTPRAGTDRAAYLREAEAHGFVLQTADAATGTLEGFVHLTSVRALAALPDTGTIAQVLRPTSHAGSTSSQGVRSHRVKQVLRRGITGKGITVGVLSDSYDTATTTVFGDKLKIHAKDDVRSRDLPGHGNKAHPRPVVILDDTQEGADEGRAMLQIIHDLAPDARLCFATAFSGDVGFADNIRDLADPKGRCKADVIVDDVGYFDEPFYSDGIIGDAVDDVVAHGATYFSAAGNSGDQNAWESSVDLVDAKTWAGRAHLDLTGVDPELYAGGLQDMNTGPGVDVAQDLALGPDGGALDVQWNDPVDVDGAQLGAPYFEGTGEITAAEPNPTLTFTPTPQQVGSKVLVTVDGIPSGSTDLILSVTTPDGTELGPIDTGSSPEVLALTLQAGTYTITVSGFEGDTGDFTANVRPVLSPSKVTTDFNVLAFAPDGSFLGALGDDNTLTGRPSEVLPIGGLPDIQIALARKTTGPTSVNRLGYVVADGDIAVAEYFDPLALASYGHPLAAGAISVAAYDPFKSYLPESYTSPGGRLKFYFDSAGRRYAKPKVRLKPDVAAIDRGNTTFFIADDARDPDDFPNFGGTSAAAPHAAAIAALLLDRAGGPGSLSNNQIRQRLQRSAFAHDLDPFHAAGQSHGLRISVNGAQGDERDRTPGSMADARFFAVDYTGKVPIRSIKFFGRTASPTALGGPKSHHSAGIVFDRRKLGSPGHFRQGGFPFVVGATSGGLPSRSVKAEFSGSAGSGSPAGQFRNLKLNFRSGLRKGQTVQFGVDRDLRFSGFRKLPIEGNGADELGGAVFIPGGRVAFRGMRFTAVLANGRRISGALTNELRKGWSPVDGYGVINAQRAVFGGR